MRKDQAKQLAAKVKIELNKHTSIYAGNKSNAAEYVYFDAVREGKLPDFKREEATGDIKAIVEML